MAYCHENNSRRFKKLWGMILAIGPIDILSPEMNRHIRALTLKSNLYIYEKKSEKSLSWNVRGS